MRILLLLLLPLLCFGCSRNHFNVPAENYASRVRVLGVAPVLIDEESDVRHPERERLLALVSGANRSNEYQLVRMLRETGNYYSVSLLDGDPRAIFSSLFFRREKRDDASIQYNKYFWKVEELRALMRRNSLDAIMLVVVSGLSKNDTVYSGNLLSSLAGEYNYLILTAQILDSNGTVLWEYPNFRSRMPSHEPLVALQYPDFSEAEANGLEKADIKFKTVEGIGRKLNEKRKDYLRRETRESEVFARQFDGMMSLLKYASPPGGKTAPLPEKALPVTEAPRPVAVPAEVPQATPAAPPRAKPSAVSAPAVETPSVPAPRTSEPKASSADDDAAAFEEIVPAPEKSR